ncbi:MAG TPA: dihydrolipoamide acetyltransferase family protein [Candidatus Binataceae bacterium]|nr:dihydrolipoamide acetyltransferase family protein [Candidatus Binataceae bacterium]
MPALGADMEAGTILQWLVKPGDAVKRGDIIAVVDTEKATIEIEVFENGVIQAIVVPEGEKVPVGTVLALIRTGGEVAMPAEPKPKPVARERAARPAPAAALAPAPPAPPIRPREAAAPPPPRRVHASPVAMRMAVDLGVDLTAVKGTGPDGAITKADVERAAKAAKEGVAAAPPPTAPVEPPKAPPAPKPAMGPAERQVAMRRVIAAAMARSKREIPHYYLGTHIDMTRAMAWLQAENLKRAVTERLLYSVLLLKAVALAAREIPEINGFWVDGAFKPSEAIHVGVAISLRQGGLIAPAIHDVGKKSLDEIMANLRDLVNRVRAGVLRSSEIADATITVTSLGEQGVESVFGVIYPPQVALVGFGKITERPWAADGMVGVKPVIMATLAADHRVSDGHRGGLFLSKVDRLLQEPEKL